METVDEGIQKIKISFKAVIDAMLDLEEERHRDIEELKRRTTTIEYVLGRYEERLFKLENEVVKDADEAT